jgi:hypothetical protein
MKKGGACAGGCWAAGKRRGRTQRLRGGMYGFQGGVITNGTLESTAAYSGPVNSSGAPIPDPTDPAGGYTGVGGRKGRASRKTRKGRKGSKKSRRKMRGGASQISAMKAGYGFDGSGSGGLANAVPAPTSGGNAF